MKTKTMLLPRAAMAAVLAIGCLPIAALADGGDRLRWSITPYVWGANTKIDLSSNGQDIGSGKVSFGDLLDMMDASTIIHVEAGKENWSGFVDLTYLKLSDRDKRQFVTIDSSSTQTYLDAAIAFWPEGPNSSLSIYGGLRYTGLDDEFKLKRTSDGSRIAKYRSDKSYSDALLGLRYRWDLSSRWSLLAQGDGSFGSSEGTWMLRGLFGYTVGERQANRILLGYQYMDAGYKDGQLRLDYTFYGPLAGFNFRF